MNTQCNVLTSHECSYDESATGRSGDKSNLLNRIIQFLTERHQQRRNRAEINYLLTLDDSRLKDIGLSHGDVMWASNLPLSTDAAVELEIIARRAKPMRL